MHQPQTLEMAIDADAFRRTEGPLAAPFQMLLETVMNVPIDRAKSLRGIAKIEVVLPAFHLPVHLVNQVRNGLIALPMISHLMQLLPLLLQSLSRRTHVQISPSTTLQVVVIAEREAQKVQVFPFLFDIHHAGLLPVDL